MAKNKGSHILVIRLSALGDVAMTIPVLFGLSKQYPDLKITVLTRAFFKPLFTALPSCEVYEAEVKKKHKGFAGLWKLYKELKAQDISMVADLHNVLRSNILKRFFSISRIPFVQIDKGRSEKGALTKGRKFEPLKNTWQRYSEVFETLGFPVPPLNRISNSTFSTGLFSSTWNMSFLKSSK
ncbi:MAG: hypothetical protein AAF361_15580 [Bacteroidota bacterium]